MKIYVPCKGDRLELLHNYSFMLSPVDERNIELAKKYGYKHGLSVMTRRAIATGPEPCHVGRMFVWLRTDRIFNELTSVRRGNSLYTKITEEQDAVLDAYREHWDDELEISLPAGSVLEVCKLSLKDGRRRMRFTVLSVPTENSAFLTGTAMTVPLDDLTNVEFNKL